MVRIKQQQGFSLMEILVAFSILAISLTVILQVFGKNNRIAFFAQDYTQALTLAESLLDAIGREEKLEAGGNSGIHGKKYHWTTTITEHTPVEEDIEFDRIAYQLFQVSVKVEWGVDEHSRSVDLNSLRIAKKDLL
jgi:general secretion pathway protein I